MLFRRAAALFAAWLGCGFLAAPRLAADGASSVQLDYEAVAGCPSAEVFASALAARGLRVESAPEAPTVRVRIRAESASFLGTLTISAASGPMLARDVQATDCGEIAAAFALVAAVTAAPGAPEPAPVVAEPAPAPPAAVAPPPVPPPPVVVAKPEPVAMASESFDALPAIAPVPRFALGLGAVVHQGVLPELGAGLLLFGERAWRPTRLFSPLLVLGVSWSRQELTRIGRARFDWVLLRTALCPWQWPRSGRASLRPCATVDTGILRGEGIDVRAAVSSTAWWLAPGAGLRAEAALGRLGLLGAAAGVFMPLFRDRFYFGPDVTLHRPKLVTFSTELTLALRFQ